MFLNKKKSSQKCHKIFLHTLLFQNILNLFFYFEKKLAFFIGGGGSIPAKNASFFDVLPKGSYKKATNTPIAIAAI